jgi:hypothetical protein
MSAKYRALPFTRFCTEVCRVQLTPGQRVLCLIAFDGLEPAQLEGDDRELARQIFGEVETIPAVARATLAAMCGARGGKTYLLIAMRALHLALGCPLTSLAPGEAAAALLVAPDLRLTRQALRYVAGAAHAVRDIEKLIEAETSESITLRRPDGHVVEIVCLPASRGGSSLRGRSLVFAGLDEAAFFRDSDFQINDVELFKAVAPRVVAGGQVVIASTPWAEAGLLHELHERNHGHPVDALAAHAPTLLLRNDEHTRSLVERETERDRENADREFGARPMAAGTAQFFDVRALKACADDDLPIVVHGTGGALGLDTAFRKDASASVVARRATTDGVITIAEALELKPPPGGRLVPSEALRTLLACGSRHGCTVVCTDSHYIETVREAARGTKMTLKEAPGGQEGKIAAYTVARREIHEGRLRVPASQKRLLAQLAQVVSKPTPGGGLSITSPRRAGAHGDIASAFVLAVWAAAYGANRDTDMSLITISDPRGSVGSARVRTWSGRSENQDYAAYAAERRRRMLADE